MRDRHRGKAKRIQAGNGVFHDVGGTSRIARSVVSDEQMESIVNRYAPCVPRQAIRELIEKHSRAIHNPQHIARSTAKANNDVTYLPRLASHEARRCRLRATDESQNQHERRAADHLTCEFHIASLVFKASLKQSAKLGLASSWTEVPWIPPVEPTWYPRGPRLGKCPGKALPQCGSLLVCCSA